MQAPAGGYGRGIPVTWQEGDVFTVFGRPMEREDLELQRPTPAIRPQALEEIDRSWQVPLVMGYVPPRPELWRVLGAFAATQPGGVAVATPTPRAGGGGGTGGAPCTAGP
ncbi:hypothetical protein O3Q52_27970 [Streptomyces sp. ActVer]|uniref:hypothetical protein n=1 Tax=Streptomyces sp. ActVer TaxID=3014558 RepID=UPI0022B5079E|nr:hypothetical protein [Streptomyces sp. ActVer]MCZ4511946.1 hypothetical protein [Streptomyces sp. ActVer]